MYQNSSTRIKLIQKLSAAIDVTIGTEQGHPMSPELFKVYIHELSTRLSEMEELNVPLLNGFRISHLLWADDLVLLALDSASLQKLLDCLNDYAEKWELTVNISKTSIMVFNTSSRILKCAHGFKLGNTDVNPVKMYCYLGIQFSLNGNFKQAIDQLRKKALRSFYSIKRTVDTRALTTNTMLKLIDCLVKPVATYGCPVWLPTTNVIKAFLSPNQPVSLPKAAAKDSLEATHLKMLKWILGIHKKANNNFCYGDTGRTPWAVSVLPQCVSYYLRASQAVPGTVNTLLYHTFMEQRQMNLTWFSTWSSIVGTSTIARPDQFPSQAAKDHLHDRFVQNWKEELDKQPKMRFYRTIKMEFGEESYLKLPSRLQRTNIAKLRSSSHDLRIERGRYENKNPSYKSARACRFCNDLDHLSALEQLPYFEDPVIESEDHVLTECPGYHHLRLKLTDNLKSLIMLKAYSTIMSTSHVEELGKYLTESARHRNPSKSDNNASKKTNH